MHPMLNLDLKPPTSASTNWKEAALQSHSGVVVLGCLGYEQAGVECGLGLNQLQYPGLDVCCLVWSFGCKCKALMVLHDG